MEVAVAAFSEFEASESVNAADVIPSKRAVIGVFSMAVVAIILIAPARFLWLVFLLG